LGFKGFKGRLILETDKISVKADIRFSKISSDVIDRELKKKIVMRDEEGKLVKEVRVDDKGNDVSRLSKVYKNEDGKIIPKDKIRYFFVNDDGKEIEVSPFERTKEFVILQLLPISQVKEFLIEGVYEVWAEKDTEIASLYKLAKYLRDTQQVAVTKMSFGGFKEYYAIITPIFKEDKFVLIMNLTRMKVTFKHLMTPVEVTATTTIRRNTQKVKATLLDDFLLGKKEKKLEKELEEIINT
jgi:hypothetical protein